MSRDVRFVWSPPGIAALAREPGMVAATEHVTNALRDAARAGSPHRTGHFQESFTTSIELGPTGAVGTLGNRDPGAVSIEVGSVHNPPFAPMRRAVRALGLKLRADP